MLSFSYHSFYFLEICRAVQAAGLEGPALAELTGKLLEPPGAVSRALSLLQQHALVCKVPGFDDWVYVACEHSAPFFVDAAGPVGAPLPPSLPPQLPAPATAGATFDAPLDTIGKGQP